MSKISGRDHENWTTNFDCIHCQIFSLKTKFIHCFIYLFILTTLVDLQNTHVIHVLNYKRNFIKNNYACQILENVIKLITKHRKMRVFQKMLFEK